MKITFLPKTRAGKWSVGMFIAFIAFSVAVTMIPEQARTPDFPNIFETPLYAGLVYFSIAAAISASIAGLIAFKKNNERSILVFLSIPLGLLYFCGILVIIVGLIIGAFFSK